MTDTDSSDPIAPPEEIHTANVLLRQMEDAKSAELGIEALGERLSEFEDQTGESIASLLGYEDKGLALGLGDLRDARAFLKAAICRKERVRLSVKLAVKVGVPAVVSAIVGAISGGAAAVPGGIAGSAAALVIYEGVESVCRDGNTG